MRNSVPVNELVGTRYRQISVNNCNRLVLLGGGSQFTQSLYESYTEVKDGSKRTGLWGRVVTPKGQKARSVVPEATRQTKYIKFRPGATEDLKGFLPGLLTWSKSTLPTLVRILDLSVFTPDQLLQILTGFDENFVKENPRAAMGYAAEQMSTHCRNTFRHTLFLYASDDQEFLVQFREAMEKVYYGMTSLAVCEDK